MPPRRYWHEMTTTDFAAAAGGGWIAVLPVAAIEQHGPHLPVYTDTCIGEGMMARALALMPADLPVTVLPTQAVGKSNEHIASPGTLTYPAALLGSMLMEIGASVARAGVRKLILVNSHGGNVPVLDIVARDLRVAHGMLAVATGWSRFGLPEDLFPAEESLYGIHGGDVETSVMLHLRPDLVRMDKARDFRSAQLSFIEEFSQLRAHGPSQFGWMAQDLNPLGALGNASNAAAEKGRLVIEHQAAAFVALCRDVHRFDLARLWQDS
ncbi:MAG: creatininase family protein [Bauldia sp.]|nr:creatininase family protein [Bauldia sp.]